jgi:hypothetical protein
MFLLLLSDWCFHALVVCPALLLQLIIFVHYWFKRRFPFLCPQCLKRLISEVMRDEGAEDDVQLGARRAPFPNRRHCWCFRHETTVVKSARCEQEFELATTNARYAILLSETYFERTLSLTIFLIRTKNVNTTVVC